MTDAVLMVIVVGVLVLGVDCVALVGWLRELGK
jgi:hypothetical protein